MNTSRLKVSQDATGLWVVEEDYLVDLGLFYLPLKAGTTSDGSSVPRAFWWVIRPSQNLLASFVHDELYKTKTYPRWFADLVYWYLIERDDGLATDFQAFVAWVALRAFGWWGWYGYGDKIRKGWLLR
jgi:hypothetical protein